VRIVVVAVLAAGLGACATRDPYVSTAGAKRVGDWRVERQVDRVTGAPLSSALLPTLESSNSAVLFSKPAVLQLTCFKDQPIVRFEFTFRIGSNRNSVLGYRFDDNPGREVEGRFLQDYKTVVIEDKDEVAQFVKELATAKMLYVRIRSLNAGRTAADFRVEGAPTAVEAALAQCPIASEPPQRRASR